VKKANYNSGLDLVAAIDKVSSEIDNDEPAETQE